MWEHNFVKQTKYWVSRKCYDQSSCNWGYTLAVTNNVTKESVGYCFNTLGTTNTKASCREIDLSIGMDKPFISLTRQNKLDW